MFWKVKTWTLRRDLSMSKDMGDWPRANLGVAAYMFKTSLYEPGSRKLPGIQTWLIMASSRHEILSVRSWTARFCTARGFVCYLVKPHSTTQALQGTSGNKMKQESLQGMDEWIGVACWCGCLNQQGWTAAWNLIRLLPQEDLLTARSAGIVWTSFLKSATKVRKPPLSGAHPFYT